MANVRITFDESAKKEILGYVDKEIDKEGFIIEKGTGERVLTDESSEITVDEFAGIKKGSEVFIKNDLLSLMRLSKQK